MHFAVQELAAASPLDADSGSGVLITDVTPGACESDLFRDDIGWFRALAKSLIVRLIARTTEVGSRALVHSVHPQLDAGAHGRFLMDCRVVE